MTAPTTKKSVVHHMAILQAFQIKPFPASTATEIRQIVNGNALLPDGKMMSQRSAESRLCELHRFTFVDTYKAEHERFTSYMMNARGLAVVRSGDAGLLILRQLAVRHAVHADDRAIELAPIKEKWERTIENDLFMLSHSLMP